METTLFEVILIELKNQKYELCVHILYELCDHILYGFASNQTLLDGIRNYLVWPAQSGKLHFWIAKDCSCPMRCGRTSVTGTTHITNFFLKFTSIK